MSRTRAVILFTPNQLLSMKVLQNTYKEAYEISSDKQFLPPKASQGIEQGTF